MQRTKISIEQQENLKLNSEYTKDKKFVLEKIEKYIIQIRENAKVESTIQDNEENALERTESEIENKITEKLCDLFLFGSFAKDKTIQKYLSEITNAQNYFKLAKEILHRSHFFVVCWA